VQHAALAHEAMPGSQVEIFEQSEHFPHMDEPGRFARVVLHFLQGTQPADLDRATVRRRLADRARTADDAHTRDSVREREAAAELAAQQAAELEAGASSD
jgi:hypothetical protein